MLTGTVWGVTLLIAGLIATIAAAQMVLGVLFPGRAARTRQALAARPGLSALVGVPAVVALVAVPAALGKAWEPGAALAGSFSILVAAAGLGAVAAEVGSRLPSEGAAAAPWRTTLRGSVALSLASLLPVAGWFLVFPLSLLAGIGAWTRSWFVAAPAEPAA